MNTPTHETPGRDSLARLLHHWQRRFRVQQTILWLSRAFLPGLLLGVVVAVISHLGLFLTNAQIALLTLAALLTGLAGLLAGVWLWPRSVIDNARRFDYQFGLQERVSTALELVEGRIHASDDLTAHQLADAYERARAVDVRAALPLTSRRAEWLAALALALLLAILLALPTQQAGATRDEPNGTPQAVAEAADEVRDAIETIAADAALDPDTRENLLEALQSNLETLRNPELSAEEALATLSEAGEALSGEAERLSELAADQQRAIEAAAEALSQPDTARADSGDGDRSAGQQAADRLNELAQSLDSLSEAERQAFAEALREAADALQNIAPDAAQSLRDAARALEDGDIDAARQAMEDAARQLEQTQAQQQAAQQLAEQMQQSSEQLQRGQEQLRERGQQDEAEMSGGMPDSDAPPESGDGGAEESDGASPGAGQDDSDGQQPGGQPGEDAQSGETGALQSAEMGAEAAPRAGDQPGQLDQDTSGFEGGDQEQMDGGPGPGGEREYEAIFAPRRPGTERTDIDIFLEDDDDNAIILEGHFEENPIGEVNVPYNEVFSDYASAANTALDQGYIPLGLRDVIRDYFTSLAPSTRQEQP